MRKNSRSKLWLSLTAGATVFFSSQVAWADPKTPAVTGSQLESKEINVALDLEGASIVPIIPYEANLKAGTVSSSRMGKGANIKADFEKKYHLVNSKGGYHDPDFTFGSVSLGAHVDADITRPSGNEGKLKLSRVKVDSGSVGAITIGGAFSVDTDDQGNKKAGTTAGITIGSAGYIYRSTAGTGLDISAVRIDAMSGNLHTGFKVAKLPVDLCLGGSLGGYANVVGGKGLGEISTSGGGIVTAKGCAGVQLGKVGRLGYDINYELLAGNSNAGGFDHHSVNQSVSLKNIGGGPMYLEASHSLDQASSKKLLDKMGNQYAPDVNQGVTTTVLSVGIAK